MSTYDDNDYKEYEDNEALKDAEADHKFHDMQDNDDTPICDHCGERIYGTPHIWMRRPHHKVCRVYAMNDWVDMDTKRRKEKGEM